MYLSCLCPLDAVAVVRKRIHNFMDHSMPVVLLESQLNLLCHAIQVSGIDWDRIKEEILKMYFRNKHRSGGGDILEIMPDKELGQAVITFASGEGIFTQQTMPASKYCVEIC